jgi:GT2 family glycosyltransferase
VIIPTRDRADLLRMCISSLLEKTRYPALEILVVDNGSQDPETHRLFTAWEQDRRFRVLPHPGAFNYSALNNAAARVANGTVLALLNNDIEALAEDWLDEMVGYALDPAIGCVGAKLYYPDGTIQHAGIVTGLLGGAGHLDKRSPGRERGYLDRLVTVRNVSAVTGACLVVRRNIYEQLGGLDEEAFGIAFNDVDFCLRAEAAGYRNVWTPFAELIHHESVSRGHDLHDRAKAARLALELAALEGRWGLRLMTDPYYSPHLERRSEAGGIRVS